MIEGARQYQAGYLDPDTEEWTIGVSDSDAEIGYYDVELDVWAVGIPDILSGEWMPLEAVLASGEHDCPPGNPIKGNLPSRIYHLPDQVTYERTIPEICFASEEAATAAGFRAAQSQVARHGA